ncbi:hypothetical protein FB451DRAFT_1561145 [Mycena latifolia]|nr:hypothetical protein FB451DRAFT_1561145 [Mycena latifolia]
MGSLIILGRSTQGSSARGTDIYAEAEAHINLPKFGKMVTSAVDACSQELDAYVRPPQARSATRIPAALSLLAQLPRGYGADALDLRSVVSKRLGRRFPVASTCLVPPEPSVATPRLKILPDCKSGAISSPSMRDAAAAERQLSTPQVSRTMAAGAVPRRRHWFSVCLHIHRRLKVSYTRCSSSSPTPFDSGSSHIFVWWIFVSVRVAEALRQNPHSRWSPMDCSWRRSTRWLGGPLDARFPRCYSAPRSFTVYHPPRTSHSISQAHRDTVGQTFAPPRAVSPFMDFNYVHDPPRMRAPLQSKQL